MKKIIEIKKHDADFFNANPEILSTEYDNFAKLSLVDAYGLIFDKGTSEPPILFVRHGNTDSYRFGGFARLSDDPIGVQTPLHYEDMAQKEATGEFRKISDSPLTYAYGTQTPFSEYVYEFGENGLRGQWKESDFFDCKAEPFPYCIVQHMGHIANFTEIIQPSLVTGILDGKEVSFIGSFDKVYVPSSQDADIGQTMAYILVIDHGIRLDGRKESYFVYINDVGQSMGAYYIEGEEPVVSEDVTMIADWFHQPYVNDGTVMYKDATFLIGNKTIHYKGKWGSKGITANPRYQKSGQSQTFGTWYEGDVPYEHAMFTTFHENMEAYDYKFEKLGFNIVD